MDVIKNVKFEALTWETNFVRIEYRPHQTWVLAYLSHPSHTVLHVYVQIYCCW